MPNPFDFIQIKDFGVKDSSPLDFLKSGQKLTVNDKPDTRQIKIDPEELKRNKERTRSTDYAERFFSQTDEKTQAALVSGLYKRVSKGDQEAKNNLIAIEKKYNELKISAQKEEDRLKNRSGLEKAKDFVSDLPGNIVEGAKSTYTKGINKLGIAFGTARYLQMQLDKGNISEQTFLAELNALSDQAGLSINDSGFDVFRKSATNFGEIGFDIATLGTSLARKPIVDAALQGGVAGVLNQAQADEVTAKDLIRGGIYGAVAGGAFHTALALPSKAIKEVYALTPSGQAAKEASEAAIRKKMAEDGFMTLDLAGDYVKDTQAIGKKALTGTAEPEFVLAPDLKTAAKAEIAQAGKGFKPEKSVNTIMEEVGGLREPVAELVSRVDDGALSIHDTLINQLGEYGNYIPDETLRKALGYTDLSIGGDLNPFLRKFGETTGVAGRYLGDYGTTSVHMLARGAKTVADIQEYIAPVLKENAKLLKNVAQSQAGKKGVQERVFLALGDRQNAEKYLQTEIEQQLFQNTARVFDFFTKQREQLGLSVIGENYRPEVMVKDALEAPEKMFSNMQTKFGTNLESPFSKERVPETDIEIQTQILDLLPRYVSSQAREFGYKSAVDWMVGNVDRIDVTKLADQARFAAGKDYMANVLGQALTHVPSDKFTKISNSLIANTYKNVLGWRPKFALQNMTQRFLSKAEVSADAIKLHKAVPEDIMQTARRNINTSLNPLTGELEEIASKTRKTSKDFAFKTEEGNVTGAFDLGFTQGLIDSPAYQTALSQGLGVEEALVRAANDPQTYEIALRYGNKVVNDTQFGANKVTKPEYFRSKGGWFDVIPDVWIKQFRRFSTGMTENVSRVMQIKNARSLDVLKVGDPRYTAIPEYRDAAKMLINSTDDVIKGIKAGEIADVPLEHALQYRNYLSQMVDNLDANLKEVSNISRGKYAKQYIKIWAALSGIQFLFDGGLFADDDEVGKKTTKAVLYGSPAPVPVTPSNRGFQVDNPFELIAPSSPISSNGGIDAKKLLNFVPGVGLAVNRYDDVKKLFNLD